MSETALGEAMLAEVVEALDNVGPRESCSPGERAFGTIMERRLGVFCDEVRAESFTCSPHAFLGFLPFVSVLTLVSLWCLPTAPALAALLGAISAGVTIVELLLYVELVDPLFPKRQGVNIVGVVRPTGEVKRRVILSAHQDSAYEFNLWYWFKTKGVIVNVLGLAAPILPIAMGTLAATGVVGASSLATASMVGWVLAPFVALHIVFHTFHVVPGAMDDLAGVAVITAVARTLAEERLEHTEVVVLAVSAEECGLRGAKRFVAAHHDELHAIPTVDINVDGVYDERFLTVVTRELTTGVKHTPALVELAETVARDHAWPMLRAMIPLGATDASAFGHGGIQTVALLCQDTSQLVPNYHTRLDTPEHIRPESLQIMRTIVLEMSRRIDRGDV